MLRPRGEAAQAVPIGGLRLIDLYGDRLVPQIAGSRHGACTGCGASYLISVDEAEFHARGGCLVPSLEVPA